MKLPNYSRNEKWQQQTMRSIPYVKKKTDPQSRKFGGSFPEIKMGKSSKKTKKFAKNKLGDAIKKRRRLASGRNAKQNKPSKSRSSESAPLETDEVIRDQRGIQLTKKHMAQLEKLKNEQKDFFEFLKNEEGGQELLDFGLDDDISESDGDIDVSDEEEEQEEEEEEEEDSVASRTGKSRRDTKRRKKLLSHSILSQWELDALKNKSRGSLSQLVRAFYTSCHLHDAIDSDKDQDGKKKKSNPVLESRYEIQDEDVFNRLIVYCVKNFANIFQSHLLPENAIEKEEEEQKDSEKSPFLPTKYPNKWKKIKRHVKIFLGATIHFLDSLIEDKMTTFMLRELEQYAPYFGPFEPILRKYLKKLLSLWESGSPSLRSAAFFNIRTLAINVPYPFINDVLKGSYLTFVRNSKFFNSKNVANVQFMANCVVVLYGLDFISSYLHAFVYLRQIAVHLRMAYNTTHAHRRSGAKHDTIYNWQTIQSISLWVRLLCAYPRQEQLWMLAYPLIQVIEGVIMLVPTPRYYPLRLYCIRLLNDLAEASVQEYDNRVMTPMGTKDSSPSYFINVAPYLLDMLNTFPLLLKRPSNKTAYEGKSPTALHFMLRCPEKLYRSHVYTNLLVGDIHRELTRYFTLFARHIAFPELVIPSEVVLSKYCKNCSNRDYNTVFRALIKALKQQSEIIGAKRNLVSFGPSDTKKIQDFLPPPPPLIVEEGEKETPNRLLFPLEKYYKNLLKKQRDLSKLFQVGRYLSSGEDDVPESTPKKSKKKHQPEKMVDESSEESEEVDMVDDMEVDDEIKDDEVKEFDMNEFQSDSDDDDDDDNDGNDSMDEDESGESE